MIENNPTNISSAFEMLLEEVEAEIDFVNGVGAKAFEGRDYEKVKEAHERAGQLTAFRDKTAALRKEWDQLAAVAEREEDEETRAERRNLGKLRKGVRTPESAYYMPILQVLDKMGGSGKVADVLERVGRIMKPILKKVDYDPLASGPDNPRWRNAAQWARNSMIHEGLLKANSPHGVWEISDQGRRALAATEDEEGRVLFEDEDKGAGMPRQTPPDSEAAITLDSESNTTAQLNSWIFRNT